MGIINLTQKYEVKIDYLLPDALEMSDYSRFYDKILDSGYISQAKEHFCDPQRQIIYALFNNPFTAKAYRDHCYMAIEEAGGGLFE